MLVDIHGVKHSVAARRIFPATSSMSRMALLGLSPVDEVVVMFRVGLVPLPFPIRYFPSSQEAMAWLLEASVRQQRSEDLPADASGIFLRTPG
ncbi:STAS/SEC14 domain-containing protein [Arthrobacter sp. NQ7]|uniref:STAS/SEC14 domain-containing protein n=1 Tax=Arthrobacter sp. NQ7 TaxID=3032303 RepID=UPI00240F403E|nr:STAS/SEC14 domain-containing protein [Arthrobacter sp. NQ7]MDJ0457058.1 STAS/SEC14 domain-containing protein [Arthrobacter sp. NQ7]